jgi:hypothetical protein
MKTMHWWTGVVEDRYDPEKLGRCKVRIFGYHTDDITLLPTSELPWAIPMQPITSAATSGVGSSPVGIVTGSWVVGWFLDAEEAQQPIIMGTIAGKPGTTAKTETYNKSKQTQTKTVKDTQGNVLYDTNNNAIAASNESVVGIDESLKPLVASDLSKLKDALGNKLSNSNYDKVGEFGELGKYQFNLLQLQDLGYIRIPIAEYFDPNAANNTAYWTGKENIKSKDDFLSNKTTQEAAMDNTIKLNYERMISADKITEVEDRFLVAGFLASAHVIGAEYADNLQRKDNYGRKAEEFFIVGNTSLGGDILSGSTTKNTFENTIDSATPKEIQNQKAFSDPEKKYPKKDYAGYTDVNKLAIGDTSHRYFTIKENKKIKNVQIANSNEKWSEPNSAYSAAYPYNQVIETEAGHILELDSTPNAERIHLFHTSGSYIEIDINGSSVRKVIGDNYELIDKNDYVFVRGAKKLTIEGKTSIYVKDDASIQVDGDTSIVSHGNMTAECAGVVAINANKAEITTKDTLNIVAGGALNIIGDSVNIQSKNNLALSASNDIAIDGKINASMRAGAILSLDAPLIKNKMGAASVANTNFKASDLPNVKVITKTEPVAMTRALSDTECVDDAEEYTPTAIESKYIRVATDVAAKDTYPVTDTNDSKLKSLNFSDIRSATYFPGTFRLSKNFTIADLSIGKLGLRPLVAQRNLTSKEIVINMRILAENVLEPLLQKFGIFQISSGLRKEGTSSSASDHDIGCAVDIHFGTVPFESMSKSQRNVDRLKHVKIAEWMTQNIPFKQLFLEFKTDTIYSRDITSFWIHIALQTKDNTVIRPRSGTIACVADGAYPKLDSNDQPIIGKDGKPLTYMRCAPETINRLPRPPAET